MNKSIVLGALTSVLVVALVFAFAPSRASAQVTPGCTATLNGVSADSIDTPGNALQVDIDSDVVASVTGPDVVIWHTVGLEYAGLGWTVSEQDDDGTSNTFTDTVPVSDYATYSVGLYKVSAEAEMFGGATCTATGYVNVTGSVLSAMAGIASLLFAMLGLLGLMLAAWLFAIYGTSLGCLVLSVKASVLTLAALGTGGGVAPAPAKTPPSAPPAAKAGMQLRWKFSLLSMISGVLGALGGLVFLQQAGKVFPTLNVTIASLVIGLLLGIGVPTLVRSVRGVRQKKAKAAK